MAEQPADLSITGLISRAPEEIARMLGMLLARGEPVRSTVGEGKLVFESRIRFVDPGRAFIILDPGTDEGATRALLARSSASFHATPGGWRIEFSAAQPQGGRYEGRAAIRMRFPEVMVSQQRRAADRKSRKSAAALRFVADAGGVISFEGDLIDVSPGGVGFVQYPPDISLEPGTLLKGCRLEAAGLAPVIVDLEVRYSTPVTLADGKHAMRSGCRFIDPSEDVKALLAAWFSRGGSS